MYPAKSYQSIRPDIRLPAVSGTQVSDVVYWCVSCARRCECSCLPVSAWDSGPWDSCHCDHMCPPLIVSTGGCGVLCPVRGGQGGGHPGKAQTLSYQNVTRKLAREVSPADLLVINCRIPLNVE